MDIALDKITEIILRLRAVEAKEGPTDPDSGSNPTDDGATDVLISGTDDATEQEIRSMIAGLNEDERADHGNDTDDQSCLAHGSITIPSNATRTLPGTSALSVA